MKLYKNMYRSYFLFEVVVNEDYSLSPKGEMVDSEQYDAIYNALKGYWKTWYSIEVDTDEFDENMIDSLFESMELIELKKIFETNTRLLQAYKHFIGKLNTEELIKDVFERWDLENLECLFEIYPLIFETYKSYIGKLSNDTDNSDMGVGFVTGMVVGNMVNKK